MRGTVPAVPRERCLVACRAACSHQCHPHPAVTAGCSLPMSSLGAARGYPLLQVSHLWEEARRGQATDGETGRGEWGLCLMAAWAGGGRPIPNPWVFPKQLLLGQGSGQSWAAML